MLEASTHYLLCIFFSLCTRSWGSDAVNHNCQSCKCKIAHKPGTGQHHCLFNSTRQALTDLPKSCHDHDCIILNSSCNALYSTRSHIHPISENLDQWSWSLPRPLPCVISVSVHISKRRLHWFTQGFITHVVFCFSKEFNRNKIPKSVSNLKLI